MIDRPLWDTPATTEYGLRRLIQGYWKPMQKGSLASDGLGLDVPGFLEPIEPTTATADHYIWEQHPTDTELQKNRSLKTEYYDLGPLEQLDLLFRRDNLKFKGFQDGMVLVEEVNGQRFKITRDLKPVQGGR